MIITCLSGRPGSSAMLITCLSARPGSSAMQVLQVWQYEGELVGDGAKEHSSQLQGPGRAGGGQDDSHWSEVPEGHALDPFPPWYTTPAPWNNRFQRGAQPGLHPSSRRVMS